jgi:hypothetical protein
MSRGDWLWKRINMAKKSNPVGLLLPINVIKGYPFSTVLLITMRCTSLVPS